MTGLFESWLFGYIGNKLGDTILAVFRQDPFVTALHREIQEWVSELPPGSSIAATDALFPALRSDEVPDDREALHNLQSCLKTGSVPDAKTWHSALLEQWCVVRVKVKERQDLFRLDEPEASQHLWKLAERLSTVCSQHEPLFRATVVRILQELLERVGELANDAEAGKAEDVNCISTSVEELLTEDELRLIRRVSKFDGECGVWAVKGEHESLWVPGAIMNMQWGWERTAREQELSGKSRGDRIQRKHWIQVVKDLVEKKILEPTDDNVYRLTDDGWRVAKILQSKPGEPPNKSMQPTR
jgi:hypothetical protein